MRSVSAVVTRSEPLTLWPMPNSSSASPLMPDPATPMRWMCSGCAAVGEALAEIGHDGVRVASMAAHTRSAASGTASARAAFAMRL